MGKKVKVRPSDQSVYFVTGKLIGRIQVPEMELMFQEDSGHEIIDFAAHDTCIFTTGDDESLRLFDSDQGMELIEPLQGMEVDSLAIQGYHLVTRCGDGQAMIVFKYTDGSEELEEKDFIECEQEFGGIPSGSGDENGNKFLMKGNLKANLGGVEYNLIMTAVQRDENVTIKMLKNKTYSE